MASSSKLVPADVMLLDQAALKAPVDSLRRLHRTTQKTFEYNLGPASSFQRELDELIRRSNSASTEDVLELTKKIDALLAKMRGLKRKLTDLSTASDTATRTAQARLSHLSRLPPTLTHPSYPNWARKRLSHQLVDYCLRSTPPLKRTAEALAREEGIEDLVDQETWVMLGKVEGALRDNKLEEVLSWVGENRVALKKLKSPLEFKIHLQAYIELCRERKLAEAIAYVKKNLSPAAVAELATAPATADGSNQTDTGQAGTMMAELSQAMALLAYAPDTVEHILVYKALYSPDRWDDLMTLFRSTFLSLHSLPVIPLLHMSLQAGLASLKTPTCCPPPSSVGAPPPPEVLRGKTADCPLCSSPLAVLAPEVPYSHHVNSTIVCPITGKVVEGGEAESNGDEPMNGTGVGGESSGGGELLALVTGQSGLTAGQLEARVYSKEGLMLCAAKHPEHKYVDPMTGQPIDQSILKKVFIS